MDALTRPKRVRLLPALAEAVADWFPELGRRSFAVSDAEITKENMPTLPLVMVALARSTSDPPSRSSSDRYEIVDAFIVEFWLEPVRYKKANGSESPFWTYYDFDEIRDALLENVARWETPNCERIAYRGLTIEADAFAVTLTFQFTATFQWGYKPSDTGEPFVIGFGLCTPPGCCPETCFDERETEPCP